MIILLSLPLNIDSNMNEEIQRQYFEILDNIFHVLQLTITLFPTQVIHVLTSIAIHCKLISPIYACNIIQWMLNVIHSIDDNGSDNDSSNDSNNNTSQQTLLLKSSFSTSYINALGLYLKFVPIHYISSHDNDNSFKNDNNSNNSSEIQSNIIPLKFNLLSQIINYILLPLEELYKIWSLENHMNERISYCLKQQPDFILHIIRLSGLLKSQTGDEVFFTFFSTISSTLFNILTLSTETYVWLYGRFNDKNYNYLSDVDTYINTSQCHIGEFLSYESCHHGGHNNHNIKVISQITDLHNTILTTLILHYNKNQLYIELSDERLLVIINQIKYICAQIQSSPLIDFITVIIRWGIIIKDSNQFDNISMELFITISNLIKQCIYLTTTKINEVTIYQSKSIRWLLDEIESCFKLARQININYFLLLLYPDFDSNNILFQLLSLINSLIIQYDNHLDFKFLQFRQIGIIFSFIFQNFHFLNQNKVFLQNLIELFIEILSNIFIGLFYGTFSLKLKGWSDIIHTIFSLTIRSITTLSLDGIENIIPQITLQISQKVFCSLKSKQNLLHFLQSQQQQPSDVQDVLVVCSDLNGNYFLISCEEGIHLITNEFLQSYNVENKKTIMSICLKLVKLFKNS